MTASDRALLEAAEALDADAALAALKHTATVEWDYVFEDGADFGTPVRRWYRVGGDGESLLPCEPDDPARDSEWWVLELPDFDIRWRNYA